MNYTKPEVSKLDALVVIQGHGKPATVAFDIPQQRNLAATVGAYESDE